MARRSRAESGALPRPRPRAPVMPELPGLSVLPVALALREWSGGAGRGAGRFLVLEPRNCRNCRGLAGDSPYSHDYIPPLQGWSVFASLPRALPWAGMFRPFRAAQSGADIPVCARPRGQTGMSAPQYHAPSLRRARTASPFYLCWRASACPRTRGLSGGRTDVPPYPLMPSASTSVPRPEYPAFRRKWFRGFSPVPMTPFSKGKKGFAGLKALVGFRLKPVLRRDCDFRAGNVP
jgi:hypothetical protein